MKTEGLQATEAECAAGRTAPRVSLSDIEANIAYQVSFVASAAIAALAHGSGLIGALSPLIVGTTAQAPPQSLSVLTIHLIVLRNGFTIIGKSAPADARNFDEELGRKLAYEDAVRQIWPLMGYALRDRLTAETALAANGTLPSLPDQTTYVGTKVLHAKPMTRGDYNDLRGWGLPANENRDDAGYLVEYADGDETNLDGFNGYVSWSPASVFERAYRPLASN